MPLVDILNFCDCLANIIKNHRAARLKLRSEHLLKEHLLHMLHGIINEQGNCLDVRDDISAKNEYFSHVFL